MSTDRCPECIDGKAWVMVSPTGHGTYRPCSLCRPATYDQWRAGAYRPTVPPEPPSAEEKMSMDEVRRQIEALAAEKGDL